MSARQLGNFVLTRRSREETSVWVYTCHLSTLNYNTVSRRVLATIGENEENNVDGNKVKLFFSKISNCTHIYKRRPLFTVRPITCYMLLNLLSALPFSSNLILCLTYYLTFLLSMTEEFLVQALLLSAGIRWYTIEQVIEIQIFFVVVVSLG